MAAPRISTPRAHHFNPQFWLAGFTETGDKDSGRLWVTDLTHGKQWQSTPKKSGNRRDFHRISDPRFDPLLFEKKFAEWESIAAPIFKALDEERRSPTNDELRTLLAFMATQWVRVPAFRSIVHGITDTCLRSEMSQALSSPENWAATRELAGIPADDPGADYEGMLEFHRSGEAELQLSNEWYLKTGLETAVDSIESLEKRYWNIIASPSGSFIGSDNPVTLDGPPGTKIGFVNAEIVVYPISRHLLLYGTLVPARQPPVNRLLIARHNTFAMLTAEQYVYSHREDFCWLDENDVYQTDWRLFSKDRFQQLQLTR